jgi:hypothetical protein
MNGSILIPERFSLNGKKIKVTIDDDYLSENKLLGEADFTEKEIILCNTYKGSKISKCEKEKIYFHELVHMILDSMARHNLKYNEDFVDEFSARLYEYEKTKQ